MQTTINVSDTLQEEPHTPAPEDTPTPEATPTQQEEGTPNAATSDVAAALAPVEEEIIDGEVTAILEPERKPAPKQPPYYMIVVGTVLACLLYLVVSLLLPLFTPSATVLIIPTEQHIATTTAIQVHGRILPALLRASHRVSAFSYCGKTAQYPGVCSQYGLLCNVHRCEEYHSIYRWSRCQG